jgi:prepilin-type N-terminal cleavage/methylation domain-containing protein
MFVIFSTITPRRRAPGAPPAPLLAATRDGHRRPRAAKGTRSRLSGEGGFTLIELLVAAALATVVFGGILGVLETSQQVQARDTEWALTMQEGRAGLARMAREIRQASEVKTHEGGTIEFLATIGGKEWKIQYECGVSQPGTEYHECVRKAVEKSTGALPSTGAPIVRDVLNPTEVFKYFKGATSTATPTEMNVVTLRIELPAKGTLKQAGSSGYTHNVVLENAAFIRNCNIAGGTGC